MKQRREQPAQHSTLIDQHIRSTTLAAGSSQVVAEAAVLGGEVAGAVASVAAAAARAEAASQAVVVEGREGLRAGVAEGEAGEGVGLAGEAVGETVVGGEEAGGEVTVDEAGVAAAAVEDGAGAAEGSDVLPSQTQSNDSSLVQMNFPPGLKPFSAGVGLVWGTHSPLSRSKATHRQGQRVTYVARTTHLLFWAQPASFDHSR